ncbi:MAG TPA: sigma-70 family RNA polymerase sigma factor [Polyangiaceae bacterium]
MPTVSGHEDDVPGALAVSPLGVELGLTSNEAPAKESSNEARVAELVEAHHDFVWRLIRRLGVPSNDVDDVVQQAFWVATRKLESIERGKERAFLASTAVRVASDYRRTVRRRRETGEEPADTASMVASAEELVDRRKARVLLDRILDRLTPDLREVLVLFELEELSGGEIAKLLGVAEGTVASRLRRAREAFSAEVRRWQTETQRRTP